MGRSAPSGLVIETGTGPSPGHITVIHIASLSSAVVVFAGVFMPVLAVAAQIMA